jgi:hypothetical protein
LVESDRHFLTLVRYVERNAQRAGLVKQAEDWPGSSVYARLYGNEKAKQLLSRWPVATPKDYLPKRVPDTVLPPHRSPSLPDSVLPPESIVETRS